MRHKRLKEAMFQRLFFSCRFNHQIRSAQIGQGQGGRNPRHSVNFLISSYFRAFYLTRQIAINNNARIVQSRLIKICYGHLISGQRQNMRNTIAHLPGPDHSNFLNIHAARSF